MKRIAAVLAVSCLVSSSWAADDPKKAPPFGEPKLVPEPVFALPFLTHPTLQAEAYRAACAKHVTPKQMEDSVGRWFTRNQALSDQVLAAGKAQTFYGETDSAKAWTRLRGQQADEIKRMVAENVSSDSFHACIDGLRQFNNGSMELANYPVHLQALGIKVPAPPKR